MGTRGGKKRKAGGPEQDSEARPWFGVKLALLGALAGGEGQGGVSPSR
jgi:hypothetical protein